MNFRFIVCVDTSYEKACGERRGSAPVTPVLPTANPANASGFAPRNSMDSSTPSRFAVSQSHWIAPSCDFISIVPLVCIWWWWWPFISLATMCKNCPNQGVLVPICETRNVSDEKKAAASINPDWLWWPFLHRSFLGRMRKSSFRLSVASAPTSWPTPTRTTSLHPVLRNVLFCFPHFSGIGRLVSRLRWWALFDCEPLRRLYLITQM